MQITTENPDPNFSYNYLYKPFKPQHQYAYYPYCFPYISLDTDKENLSNNQGLYLLSISFILIT